MRKSIATISSNHHEDFHQTIRYIPQEMIFLNHYYEDKIQHIITYITLSSIKQRLILILYYTLTWSLQNMFFTPRILVKLYDKLFLQYSSLLRGGHLIISSTRRIISAASDALVTTLSLDL